MKQSSKRKSQAIIAAASSLLSLTIGATQAHAAGSISSLTGYDINESSFLKDNGITINGNANAGITYNGNNPTNGFNGPVTFGDRSSEFQLNQLNLSIAKAVATEGDKWSFGGRFDAMFGTDSIFTQAYGVPALNYNAPGQALSRNNWDLNILGTAGNRFYGLAYPKPT